MAASAPAKRTPRKRAATTRARGEQNAVEALTGVPLDEAPTSVSAWRKGSQGEDLRVPSGNVCRVRRVSMREWLKEGIVPDSLRPIIDRAIAQGSGANMKRFNEDLQKKATDPKGISEMFEMVDRVVAMIVSKPVVVYHQRLSEPGPGKEAFWEEIPVSERNPDALYTDEIQDEDKFFLFNFAVGGVRDLERFRQQFGSSVAALRGGEELGD